MCASFDAYVISYAKPALKPLAKFVTKLIKAGLNEITKLFKKLLELLKKIGKEKILNGASKVFDEVKDFFTKIIPNKVNGILNKSKKKVIKTQCFGKGTMVYTPIGYIPIEEIKIGDLVYSKNEDTGEFGVKEVKELSLRNTYVLYNITIGNEVIQVTSEHPFWVYGKGFISTEDLVVGDEIVIHDEHNIEEDGFGLVGISNIEKVFYEELQPVYNFTVEDWHTYFVGDCCIFVHNGNCDTGIKEVEKNSKFEDIFNISDNYTLKDNTFNNHILSRHGSNSKYFDKSHFNANFDIKAGIDSTLKNDNFILKSNTSGRAGYIFEQTFSNPIGTSSKGKELNTLKVVIDEFGNVITAFPKK